LGGEGGFRTQAIKRKEGSLRKMRRSRKATVEEGETLPRRKEKEGRPLGKSGGRGKGKTVERGPGWGHSSSAAGK